MFGFGKGKIEVQIDKFNFKPGETIEGTVALKLNKPIKAKGVKIKLEGIRTGGSMMMTGRHKSTVQKILDIEQELDGEKEYPATPEPLVYPFRIQIPSDLLKKPELGSGAFGQIVGAAQTLSNLTSRVKWELKARLDIAMGMDVSKTVRVNIIE